MNKQTAAAYDRICDYLAAHPGATKPEMGEGLNISISRIDQVIRRLKADELVRVEEVPCGKGRTRKWFVVDIEEPDALPQTRQVYVPAGMWCSAPVNGVSSVFQLGAAT